MQAQGLTTTRSRGAKGGQAPGRPPAVAPPPAAPPLPAARPRAWLLCQDTETRSAAAQTRMEQRQQSPALPPVQQLVPQGIAMIRQRQAAELDAWLQACPARPSVERRHCAAWLQRD
jgi:hypothetical protein